MNLDPIIEKRCKERLKVLMPQYKKAILKQDLKMAKNLIVDVQPLLKKLEKNAQLVELKNQLFELALINNEVDYSIEGLLINKKLANKNTRLYLDATALLAIGYLRKSELEKAKPCIQEVLQNKNIIKTESTRRKFNEEIIKRFDEECVLASLKNDKNKRFSLDEINLSMLKDLESKTENELYIELGILAPKSTKDLLYLVDIFSKKQLTFEEQKLLTSSDEEITDDKIGKTIFSSFKQVLYKSICDPSSEVYKGWYTNGVGITLDKKYMISSITAIFIGYGIGYIALIVSAAVLILRFGLNIYCERYKPISITELRRKGD